MLAALCSHAMGRLFSQRRPRLAPCWPQAEPTAETQYSHENCCSSSCSQLFVPAVALRTLVFVLCARSGNFRRAPTASRASTSTPLSHGCFRPCTTVSVPRRLPARGVALRARKCAHPGGCTCRRHLLTLLSRSSPFPRRRSRLPLITTRRAWSSRLRFAISPCGAAVRAAEAVDRGGSGRHEHPRVQLQHHGEGQDLRGALDYIR